MAEENKPENKPAEEAVFPASFLRKFNLKKNLPLAVVIVGVLCAGTYLYINKAKLGGKNTPTLTAAVAGDVAIKYVNTVLLKGGQQATLKGVSEENGLYKVKINIANNDYDTYITKDGKTFFPEGRVITEATGATITPAPSGATTIGNFSVNTESICKESDKPIVYFFGSVSCPHCKWEDPIIEEVMKNFTGLVSYHRNIDSQENMDVFSKYSDGGIPTLVFGCKYYRVGSGESAGAEQETKVLTALACKLTGNQPAATCAAVKDLVDQITQ